MKTKLQNLFMAALTLAASTQKCSHPGYFRMDWWVEILEL